MAGLIREEDTQVLGLAPHCVSATKANLERMGIKVPVSLFVPIFPIGLDCTTEEMKKASGVDCAGGTRKGFVLQGLFQTHR